MNFERIISKVRSLNVDAYLTVDKAENFYLTRFSSSFGISVVFSNGELFFFTDGRYFEKARREIRGFEVVKWKNWEEFFKKLKEEKIEKIAVDPNRINLSTFRKLTEKFEVIEKNSFLDEFRSVKSCEEISLITRAINIAELSLKSVLHLLKPGITEKEFRKELISAFFKFGGEGEAFSIIVASGKGAAIPHWETSDKEIKDGNVVIVDFGTIYRGYVSDITRTFLIGNVSIEIKKIYDVVQEAQKIGIYSLKAGQSCKEVDLKVRNYIKEKGYGDYFVHSTGHGIGIEVHESPTLSFKSEEILKSGMVVTVEPGIYIPELGGVRIEDDCLVTKEGCFVLSV
ncbi:M24 family metallopeptidase [Desulfurobacterium thermolithotrophum]|uniref:M24 family metallopeptidase n=1 Tax=Desulfurobacterium thermolithotrophum TaxID=64160 RepID=UPI0013D05A3A|nr:aminopeptidase P family protein [Desulfurobacterium thermolithotrophum]